MLGHRELTMREYMEILKRRFWLILASSLVCLGISLTICHFLPSRYTSQTLVLIEQQKVPEDYVKPVVNEDLNARLASMKEQILSRSRIEPIITQFGLYPKISNMDDKVELTQKAIGINPIPYGQGARGMPGFFITFKASDARTAQQVCGEITSLFVSENLNAREQSAEGTTDFLRQQLDDAKRNLNEQDAKLADFQRKNLSRLPGQTIKIGDLSLPMGSANESTLQALTTRLEAATQTINRLQQDETFIQAMVTEQSQTSSHGDSATGGGSPSALQLQLKEALQQEKELEGRYTPDYPDVVASKRRIANLRAEIARETTAPAKDEASVNTADSPQLKQLKLQLRAIKMSLVGAKQEQAAITEQVKAYESKIEASPMIEEEYKEITRDHETAQQFYNTLLTKMNESSMATALEHRQQGEQFRVMDAPNLPEEPTFPNRRVFGGGGLAAGLALGLLIAGLLEYRDTSVRNEADIWAFTKLPTLAIVSYIKTLERPNPTGIRGRLKKLISRNPKPMESARA
jgi:polysaccharide chain length determinant protein (PEP-CTERM system associated)